MNKSKMLENYAKELSVEKLYGLGRNFSKLVITRTGLGLYTLRLVSNQENFQYNRVIYKNAKRVGEFLDIIKEYEEKTNKVLYIQYPNGEFRYPSVEKFLYGQYTVDECLTHIEATTGLKSTFH